MKRLNRRSLLVASAVLLPGVAFAQPPAFAPGQVWSIRDLPTGYTNGLTVIGRVEPFGADVAVHASVQVDPPPGAANDPLRAMSILAHLPFAADAFARSVDRLIARNTPPHPNFDEGYETWRRAVEQGNAGIFTITIGEIFSQVILRQ